MKTEQAYNVQLWCGLKEGYDGITHTITEVEDVCQKYVNLQKTCITVTPTKFIYVDGKEDGFVIGFIAYPRFTKTKEQILGEAVDLGKILLKEFKQYRLTITTPDSSIMLEADEDK
jgi:hypothetical protein